MAVKKDDARYAYNLVKRICTEVGPGVPCSEQERKRALIIKSEMENIIGAKSVAIEGFTCAPNAFLGWFKLAIFILSISLMFHFLSTRIIPSFAFSFSIVSFILALSVIVIWICEFVLYYEFIDPLFKKKSSLNIVGSIKPEGSKKIEKILIFAGHHDSALEFNWLKYLKYAYYPAIGIMMIGIMAIAIFSGLYCLGTITGNSVLIEHGTINLPIFLCLIVPAFLLALFFTGTDKNGGTVPGAADNLSASAVTLAIGRILMRQPELIPANTEVRLISFGSEEAGLRGSSRYVARHLQELLDHDACLCNMETISDPVITILKSDCNGVVKNSPEIVAELKEAADNAGVPSRVKPFPFGGGGTDTAPFSRAGLKSACLLPFKIPQQMIKFYHQSSDDYTVLTIEPLLNTLKVAIEWMKIKC